MRDTTIKEKSGNHKATNVFRFQSFTERIHSVKITSRKLVLSEDSEDHGMQSELSQAIAKWQDLNLSQGFKDFVARVGGNIHNKTQVLQKESHISESLAVHLENADPIALAPLLSCLVAFAADTYHIFYEKYFFKFIPMITEYGNSKCHQSVEEVFVCLASLFVLLHSEIKNDVFSLLFEHKYFDYFSKKHVWYINELAAQSLSFITRTLPNKQKFYERCFSELEENRSHVEGFSRLLFNSFKLDVPRRLHYMTKDQLSIIFEVMRSNPSPQSVAVVCGAFKYLTKHVTAAKKSGKDLWQNTWKEDSAYVWPVFYTNLQYAISNKDVHPDFLEALFKVCMSFLEHYKGALLLNVTEFVDQSSSLLMFDMSDSAAENYVDLVKVIFTHQNVTGDHLTRLINMIFESKISTKIILGLIEHIAGLSNFDTGKHQRVLEYLQSLCKKDDPATTTDMISTAASIVMTRCTPLRCAKDADTWSRQFLDFSIVFCKIGCIPEKTMVTVLNQKIGSLQDDLSNVDAIVLSCICIGHLPTKHSQICVSNLCNILELCLKQLSKAGPKRRKSIGELDQTEMYVFLFGIVVEALFHTVSAKVFCDKLSSLNELLEIKNYASNVHFLKVLDLYLTSLQTVNRSLLSVEYFETLYKILSPTLAASHPIARMITIHIFSLFKVPLLNTEESGLSLFNIFLQAEETAVSPYTFKERLRLLSLIDADHICQVKSSLDFVETAPLQFLIGQLRINFKDLWAGVMSNIAGHARALPIDVFWPFWLSVLKTAADEALEELCGQRQLEVVFESENLPLQSLYTVLMSHDSFGNLTSRQSALEFRDHLWTCMVQFPEICERKSRDVVILFQNYISKELFPNDENLAKSQNLLSQSNKSTTEDEPETGDEEDEPLDRVRKARKAPIQSFFNHVSVLSKFKNPRSMHKAQDLQEIYLQFLSHPYVKAQKVALDALMSYKYKYLKPYKDFLYNLLDDKTMKDELTLFSFDGSGTEARHCLKSEHRKELMPIVLRILYGRKQIKNTSGKGKSSLGKSSRKSIILKFLARCNSEELSIFRQLAFGVFDSMIEGDMMSIVTKALNEANPQNVIPPKRMQGAFNSIEEFMDSIGNLLSNEQVSMLLKVLFFMMSTSAALLSKKDSISPGFSVTLKKLKKATTQRTIAFFGSSVMYPWAKSELDAMFLVLVRPALRKIQYDASRNTPAILKLMEQWAENPRYHILFAKEVEDGMTCFHSLLKLLQQDGCLPAALKVVMKIIEGLLSEIPAVKSHAPIPEKLPVETLWELEKISSQTVGQQIVCHFRNDLMVGFKTSLSSKTITNSELSILEKVSPWITESAGSQELTSMILNLLATGSIKDDKKQKYMLTITRDLIHVLENPEKLVRTASSLFGILSNGSARTLLCDVVAQIASKKTEYKELSAWCHGLNSRSLDQFDVEKVTLQLIKIRDFLEAADGFRTEECFFLVHTLFWMLENIKTDNLSDIIISTTKVVLKTSSKFYDKNPHLCTSVVDCTLSHIRNLLKHSKPIVVSSTMRILCDAIHLCHNISPRLGELFLLVDQENPNNDFFAVLCGSSSEGLQLLVKKLSDDSLNFSKNTINEFLVPICGRYLFNDQFITHESIINNSIACIASLSKRLAWTNYRTLLKYYISQVQKTDKFQRVGIKLLEALLDNFHEDISENILKTEHENGDENKATLIYNNLAEDLIPKLKMTLVQTTEQEKRHKSNRTKLPEEDHIKRMPLAFAIVKLLQKLPKQLLDDNIQGIIFNLLNYLKSKSDKVREQSRYVLVKIMAALGSEYLPQLIKDFIGLMTKGFHRHVMVMTLHCILNEMKDSLNPNHLINSVEDIVSICIRDSFGTQSEEKTSTHMSRTYSEARTQKSFDIMVILGSIVQTEHLQIVVSEIEDVLDTQDKKVVEKVTTHLHKFANGLEGNDHIDLKTKATFMYKLLSSKLDQIEEAQRKKDSSSTEEYTKPPVPDCFIIEPEPRRAKPIPKVVETISSHSLVDFCLHLLHQLLRHKKFQPKDQLHRQLLDGFVPLLNKCLVSEYPRVCMVALNVASFLIPYDLPSFNKQFNNIYCRMFVILDKFASFSQAQGENYQMIQLIFKTLALFISQVDDHRFADKHIRVLLEYTKINLPDSSQHHSTFPILKAIIRKKFNYDELHALMDSVRDMSIKTDIGLMRDQARTTYLAYILNYPKKESQLMDSWKFYLSNLEYPVLEGRKSALVMVQDLIEKFPRNFFNKKSELVCFTQLTQCIVKDSTLREMYKDALQSMYEKSKMKEALISQAIFWLQDAKRTKIQVAFSRHLAGQSLIPCLRSGTTHPPLIFKTLMSKIIACLEPANFSKDDNVSDEEFLRLQRSLNSLLEVLIGICDRANDGGKYGKLAKSNVWNHIVEYLAYPNIETRLHCVTLINSLFMYHANSEGVPSILSTTAKIRSLAQTLPQILWTTSKGISDDILDRLTNQTIKALVYLVKTTDTVPVDTPEEGGEQVAMARGAYFVLHNIGEEAYKEMKTNVHSISCRKGFLKLIAGLSVTFRKDLASYKSVCRFIVSHITRELSDPGLPPALKDLTQDTLLLVKDHMGSDFFTTEYDKCKKLLKDKKESRKRKLKETLSSNPEAAARKKQKIQQINKQKRKRKQLENATFLAKKLKF